MPTKGARSVLPLQLEPDRWPNCDMAVLYTQKCLILLAVIPSGDLS